MTDTGLDDPLALISVNLSNQLRLTVKHALDPEVESERITYEDAFQIMLTSLTYELIDTARAAGLSVETILAGVQQCWADGADTGVRH